MKKRLVSMLLALVMFAMLLPAGLVDTAYAAAATAPKTVAETQVREKLSELATIFKLNSNLAVSPVKAYFTKNAEKCPNGPTHKSCAICDVKVVLAQSWIRKQLSVAPDISLMKNGSLGFVHYFEDSAGPWKLGTSCCGFANFVGWFLFAGKSTDKVSMQIVNPKDMSFTYANMKQGRIGDILRLKKSTDSKSSHSVVFLSCDKNGMKVLDCNWPDSNGKCNSGVQIHVIPWNNYKQATISRAKNYDITQTVYQVTYNVNGGNESSCPAAQVKKQGEVLTLTSSKPTRNGAEFLGWSTQEWPQNVEYAAGAKYTKDADVKLHAVWKFAPGTYKVDGTIGSAYFRAEADPTSKMLGNIPEGTQFKISKFDGNWGYIKYNGNWGYVSMRYTALISLAKYTFVYHANSGKGTMPQQTITYGQKFTLAANSFTRDGYGFVGWTIKRYSDNTWISEGHGWMTEDKLSNAGYEKRIYPDSATKTFDTSWTKGYDGVSNYDLYAVWEKISAPATVTLGTAKAGANGIKVTWKQAEGAVKYNVYRRTADTKWTSAPLATVSGTSFTDKTVKAGETYIYTVRGIASDGKSLSTGYDKNGVTATALPATVKLTGAKASGSSIVVTWSKAEGAVRYRVYRQAAGESSWTTLTSSATGTSYTDKKAKAGVTYTYTVRALNAANGLSAGYDKNGVKAIIAPATVTLGTAKAGASGITVTWAKADGAVKYNVYRRTADTKWTSAPAGHGERHQLCG